MARLDPPSRVGARTRLTFTAALTPAGKTVDEVLAGFVGTARVLFCSTLGARTTSELFTVAPDAAYRLYRQVGEGPWQLLTRPQLPDTLYTDTALAPGQPHRYRVTALDAAGQELPPSAEATADVPPRAGPQGHRY